MRRIVTGHNAAGKSVFLSDGEPPRQIANKAGGLQLDEIWGSEGTPVLPISHDDPTLVRHTWFPGPAGCRFLAVHFLPASSTEKAIAQGIDPEKATQEFFGSFPGLGEHMEADNPGMHASQTIDFGVVLKGEVDLELDDGVKKRLKAGDCLVQGGARHKWSNPGAETCLMVFTVVGASRK